MDPRHLRTRINMGPLAIRVKTRKISVPTFLSADQNVLSKLVKSEIEC